MLWEQTESRTMSELTATKGLSYKEMKSKKSEINIFLFLQN